MTDTPIEPPVGDRIQQVDLQLEMQRSYLDYAMSVIVGRALPDVRDGLKPVHRRILYAMYDGGYRPDRQFSKCSRVVGDVMGQFHPHGDSAIYDALVRLAQPWSLRYPLVAGQGNFGSPGNDPAAAPRYTECRMAPLAMEMVRDIDEDTVDFGDNYDGRTQEPLVLPARFPNLLVNGSAGIAVGMATNIPPHNLREIADGVQWALENPDATREELLDALLARVQGPDFPTGALIMGRRGITDAYRTGRGQITMRAVVEVEEIQNRTCLVVTELPYQVNPDNLAAKIADLVKDGRLAGIADIRDETSGRTGQRLVIVLKRDAVAKVVLNNLYKHTQLQETFGANMLALVEGVPRTLSLDAFVRLWVDHQLDVIVRRTRYRLRKAQERMHIVRALLKALDALDEVIALIRRSATVDDARTGLMALLEIDEIQASAILDMQLRRLAALERQKLVDEHAELEARIADYEEILATPSRQRLIVSTELAEIVDKFGDERRTRIVPFDGDMSMADLVPVEDVVVTITRDGYAKRTRVDNYRSQRRGGKGVRGAQLREDDVVEHFFATSTHDWLLFFTNFGRVYRAKAYELPEAGRDAKGQHVANLLAFQPGEQIAQVLRLTSYDQAEYLVLATREGRVKKTALTEYDSNRSGGLIAIKLRELGEAGDEAAEDADAGTDQSEDAPLGSDRDELVGVRLVNASDDIVLVSRKGMSLRFLADDKQLRPMGRSTSGVTGMKFRDGDELLAMVVVRSQASEEAAAQAGDPEAAGDGAEAVVAAAEGAEGDELATVIGTPRHDLFVVFENGNAKRTHISEYRVQGRAGLGIKVAATNDRLGSLVGALMVRDGDEVLVVMEKGKVVRSSVDEVAAKGRDTQGVIFAKPDPGDSIIAITRNVESTPENGDDEPDGVETGEAGDGEGAAGSGVTTSVDSPIDAVDGSASQDVSATDADAPASDEMDGPGGGSSSEEADS
ncbi:MAG: DNA gyrase subunit A [Actinomycetales bacterium]